MSSYLTQVKRRTTRRNATQRFQLSITSSVVVLQLRYEMHDFVNKNARRTIQTQTAPLDHNHNARNATTTSKRNWLASFRRVFAPPANWTPLGAPRNASGACTKASRSGVHSIRNAVLARLTRTMRFVPHTPKCMCVVCVPPPLVR